MKPCTEKPQSTIRFDLKTFLLWGDTDNTQHTQKNPVQSKPIQLNALYINFLWHQKICVHIPVNTPHFKLSTHFQPLWIKFWGCIQPTSHKGRKICPLSRTDQDRDPEHVVLLYMGGCLPGPIHVLRYWLRQPGEDRRLETGHILAVDHQNAFWLPNEPVLGVALGLLSFCEVDGEHRIWSLASKMALARVCCL